MRVYTDLLLLQSVIRTPANADVDILVRQATVGTMRETLKEIDKRGFANIFVHLSTHDTYRLLRAVSLHFLYGGKCETARVDREFLK